MSNHQQNIICNLIQFNNRECVVSNNTIYNIEILNKLLFSLTRIILMDNYNHW